MRGGEILKKETLRKYAFCNIEDIYNEMDTGIQGLTFEQVDAKREKFGGNQLFSNKNDTVFHIFKRAFVSHFTIILFFIAILSLITDVFFAVDIARNMATAVIIFIMILISGTIRLAQEFSAKKESNKLERFANKKVKVKRNGIIAGISAEELVAGDLVIISTGDQIPADIRLIKSENLFVSQASITGESAIIRKDAKTTCYSEEVSLSQIDNLVFMTTTVISGRGQGIVLAVGKETVYGDLIIPKTNKLGSFQKGENSISKVMIHFMAVLIPAVFIASGILKADWMEALGFSLSIAIGLTPEMLPMVAAACLAKGSFSMSKKKTIIKNINAMQGFGSMDIICMDKTGTLTNENILLEYYMDVFGDESELVLDLAYLNRCYHSTKNHIDNAILECITMPDRKDHYENLIIKNKKVYEIPFDYNRKYVSVLLNSHDDCEIVMKGSIDKVISKCKYVEYKGESYLIDDSKGNSVSAIVDEMLEDGMKVIAVARKKIESKKTISLEDENDMTLVGYIAFFDAPKKSASLSISSLKRLQIIPKILTGDEQKVALSICSRVGIAVDSILTGSIINTLSDSQLSSIVEKTHVYAGLTPAQKVRVLKALQENGHTVGYLGDGMNDVPALGQADVGISVENAVDVAKDIADVVLLQKDLNILEQAILEGRKIFVNMQKYIKITASSNLGNILSFACASVILPFSPMTSIQLLLLNLLYDILCIVLPWDNVDEEELLQPREWSGKTLSRFMISFGPISSIIDIITFVFLYFLLCPNLLHGLTYTQITDPLSRIKYVEVFQTGWFLESMWTQTLILHFLRTKKIPFIQSRPSVPVLVITLTGIMIYTSLTFTDFSSVMELTRLPLGYFVFLLIIVVSYMLIITLFKNIYQKKYRELI